MTEMRNDDQHGMAAMPDRVGRSEPDPTVRNASTPLTVIVASPHRVVGAPGLEDDAPATPVEAAATVPHMGDRCAAALRACDAHGPLTTAAVDAPAMPVEGVATVPHVKDCSASNATVRGAPTTAQDQAHETPHNPATARPHVKDRCVPGHVVRDAREALTTAGYKTHEARAAVERALTQLDDQVTLPQLIRQALRCCAIAHR
jgi:hypothetical protein